MANLTLIDGVDVKIYDMEEEGVTDLITSQIPSLHGRDDVDDAFYIADLGDVVRKFYLWKQLLPRIRPFYAVKCNSELPVIRTLAHLGTGFDCASKLEIQTILSLGVNADRIVYANPCKQKSHLKYAAQVGASLMTFDNEAELIKIHALYPSARLILRILTDDSTAQCQLGLKYGCHPLHAPYLLKIAHQLNLDVVGVSFHVGSGCRDAHAYNEAIRNAKSVMEHGTQLGFKMHILDIGGGFPGQKTASITFPEVASVISSSLDTFFPEGCGVDIIAEPGRFFVASAFTLAVNITAKRVVARDIQTFKVQDSKDLVANSVAPTKCEEPAFMYFVNDGVYGSFNCILYDHATVFPKLLKNEDSESAPKFSSSIWGPSCDGLDRIIEHCCMRELEVGEWLYFEDMGAYTVSAGSEFNGFRKSVCFYVLPQCMVHELQKKNKDFTQSCSSETCKLYSQSHAAFNLDKSLLAYCQ